MIKEYLKPNPSQVTDGYWIYAERKTGKYSEATDRSGKWLIFLSPERIDAVWNRVKKATEEGRLGGSAKAATAKPNSNATDPGRKVICVYSYNWEDKEDVMRIRAELRALGIRWKIPYKADVDTDAGKYRAAGHTRISKYYE